MRLFFLFLPLVVCEFPFCHFLPFFERERRPLPLPFSPPAHGCRSARPAFLSFFFLPISLLPSFFLFRFESPVPSFLLFFFPSPLALFALALVYLASPFFSLAKRREDSFLRSEASLPSFCLNPLFSDFLSGARAFLPHFFSFT